MSQTKSAPKRGRPAGSKAKKVVQEEDESEEAEFECAESFDEKEEDSTPIPTPTKKTRDQPLRRRRNWRLKLTFKTTKVLPKNLERD